MNQTGRLHGAPKRRCDDHVYTITHARRKDLPKLAAIEVAAAKLLTGHAPDSVLRETTSRAELRHAQIQGHLWVALVDDVPVGFAHVEILEPRVAHLKEIDVHPDHGRRGIGTRLVMSVCNWAALAGYSFISLTTFRDVLWNMPFYAKLGFVEIEPEDLSSPLRPMPWPRSDAPRRHAAVMCWLKDPIQGQA